MRLRCAILLIIAALLWTSVTAQEVEMTGTIDSVTITAVRPLEDIGLQRTALTLSDLRESITLSLADILSTHSDLFIKSAGRATMATASLRGTQSSDLQVLWNGLSLNSPMMGMTDFSYIPAYFIDRAEVYNGASSMSIAGSGLGGAVELSTIHNNDNGFAVDYVQSIGSWQTFDEFLALRYGNGHFSSSTRASLSTSENDFTYTNYDRKEFTLDENGLITNFYYPTERNRNGSFCDAHILQELRYVTEKAGTFSLSAWFMSSRRGIPTLSTSYYDDATQSATQSEQTLRAIANWTLNSNRLHFSASGGYAYSDLLYFATLTGGGVTTTASDAQSYIHTIFASADVSALFSDSFYGELTGRFNQYFVNTADFARLPSSPTEPLGYIRQRAEGSIAATLRYRPWERFGVATTLRSEIVGEQTAPLLAAAFADYTISKRYGLIAKISVASNYRFPSLNDLYYRPGGNPNLRPEHGITADAGLEMQHEANDRLTFGGRATAYYSHITDWIVWRPTAGGYFTPTNIALVESYGAELSAFVRLAFSKNWQLSASGRMALTRSSNRSPQLSDADRSKNAQLPYIPLVTASINVALSYQKWDVRYQFNHYSRRYTTTDNSFSVSGSLPPYYMSDVSLGRRFDFRWATFSVRFTINNLLGEEYVSILSHPMPRRNFALTIEFSPKF